MDWIEKRMKDDELKYDEFYINREDIKKDHVMLRVFYSKWFLNKIMYIYDLIIHFNEKHSELNEEDFLDKYWDWNIESWSTKLFSEQSYNLKERNLSVFKYRKFIEDCVSKNGMDTTSIYEEIEYEVDVLYGENLNDKETSILNQKKGALIRKQEILQNIFTTLFSTTTDDTVTQYPVYVGFSSCNDDEVEKEYVLPTQIYFNVTNWINLTMEDKELFLSHFQVNNDSYIDFLNRKYEQPLSGDSVGEFTLIESSILDIQDNLIKCINNDCKCFVYKHNENLLEGRCESCFQHDGKISNSFKEYSVWGVRNINYYQKRTLQYLLYLQIKYNAEIVRVSINELINKLGINKNLLISDLKIIENRGLLKYKNNNSLLTVRLHDKLEPYMFYNNYEEVKSFRIEKTTKHPRLKCIFASNYELRLYHLLVKHLTLSHIAVNMRIADIFYFDNLNSEETDFYWKGHFDFIIYNRDSGLELIVECDGPNHELDEKVISYDKLKESMCSKNGIAIVRVNAYDLDNNNAWWKIHNSMLNH